jgi:hypothetical protein
MRHGRFQRLLEAYGADPARWPEDERAAAERHMAADPAARAAVEAERRLDALLGRLPPVPEPSIALPLALPAQRRPLLQRLLHAGHGAAWSMWPRVATLAMASVVGVVIGLSGVADRYSAAQEGDAVTSVFDSAPSGGWEL